MRLIKPGSDREKNEWREQMLQPCIRGLSMRLFASSLLAVAVTSSIWAQQPTDSGSVNAGPSAVSDTPHSRQESFGSDDVIKVSVYDSPELTGNVHVDSQGDIRLPIMRQHIRAAGLTPDE